MDDYDPIDVQNIRHAIKETYPTRHPEVLAKFDAILREAARAYRLREALLWYADPGNHAWRRTINAEGETVKREEPLVLEDFGLRAQDALIAAKAELG